MNEDDDISSGFSEIEIPNNIKHRFTLVSDEDDNEDNEDNDVDDIDNLKETELNLSISNMFSNLRGKQTNPKIELYASSKNINMNWNIVL